MVAYFGGGGGGVFSLLGGGGGIPIGPYGRGGIELYSSPNSSWHGVSLISPSFQFIPRGIKSKSKKLNTHNPLPSVDLIHPSCS